LGKIAKNVFNFIVTILKSAHQNGLRGWLMLGIKTGSIVGGLLVFYILILWLLLPDVSDPRSLLASQSSVIIDRNGVELYRLFQEEDRTYIEGSLLPQHMKNAIIAIEDQRFYDRGCLDIRAIARAVVLLGQAGGGSTITRQLARNALDLKQENRYQRKIKEFILGCQLEREYEKTALLELYLNWIPFGQNAYGIEQASRVYFGHSASGLTLAESAVLASLPQRPSYFTPYGSHLHTTVSESVHEQIVSEKITKLSQIDADDISIGLLGADVGTGSTTLYIGGRTDQVLRNMQNQGVITDQERLAALEDLSKIVFQPSRENIRAAHFVLWIRDQVEEMFEGSSEEGLLEQGGLLVQTTLDWEMQQAAETVVDFHKEDIQNRFGANNLALLSVDTSSQEILAYVGNMDFNDEEHGGKIDMVHVPRQPGSSFKPFVYAAAFEKGYGPATVLYDVPTKIGDDEPQNFDGRFWGLMTIRNALGASRNIPAAKAFFLAGGEDVILSLLSRMGVTSPLVRRDQLDAERPDGFEYGWPLALGAGETPLYEMVQGYSTFAKGGEFRPLVSILKITDKNGNLLYEAEQEQPDPVLDPRIAYQITSVLSDESARPEEYWRNQLTIPGYQTAAKTGTSNKCLERKADGSCDLLKPDNAWLMGYTPNMVTGVWIGNADSSSMYERAGGLNTASSVWRDYMMRAHRFLDNPVTTFSAPSGIVQPQISTLSGQLPTACTPVQFRKADVFLEENAPTEPDPACAQLEIDKLTKLLASDSCPAEARESGSFLVARSLLPDRWPTWEEGVQKWVNEQMEIWYASESHSGSLLPLPVAPTEACDASLTPGRLVKPTLEIEFPSQNGIATYPTFKPQISFSAGAKVQEIRYEIDTFIVKTDTSAPFDDTLRIPRTVRQDGSHTLKITLIDEYFNEVTDTVNFRFGEDKNSPTVRIISPSRDVRAEPGSELHIEAAADDPDGGIKYVQFYLDDTLLTTKPAEPYEFTYTLPQKDGTYRLRAVAEDSAKNTAEDEIVITIGEGGAGPLSFFDAPSITTPVQDQLSFDVNDILDVTVRVPSINGQDVAEIELFVRNEQTSEEESLLKLTSGSGDYKRQWKAAKPGDFTMILRSVDRANKATDWETKSLRVQ